MVSGYSGGEEATAHYEMVSTGTTGHTKSVRLDLQSTEDFIAEAYSKQLDDAKVFRAPIVTQVVPLKAFYPAEEHHQNFCNRNPRNPCVLGVAMPEVEKVNEKVSELAKEK